jgi:hypothetical protein
MAAAAPPTVAPDGASDKIINPRRSERLKKIEPTPATSVDIQPRSTLRARRPVDPVRRRKQGQSSIHLPFPLSKPVFLVLLCSLIGTKHPD